ncbi:MAG: sodium:solute symporter [Bdellovibrionales bacterium]
MTFSTIDYLIIFSYLGITMTLGLWIARKEVTNDTDFFVAGRSLGWFAVGASLFASNISSEHIIGLATDGFRTGLAVGNYEWGATLILIVLGAVFVPFYVGSKIKTMPEFLEKRFGKGAKFYLSIMTIVANVLVRISVAMFAAGLVLEKIFEINFWWGIVLLSIVTLAYTVYGGLKAVVYTDSFQAVILLAGTFILSYVALSEVGGWSVLTTKANAMDLDMVRPLNDPEMPWLGLVVGVPVLGIWYWCTDQVIVQRVLGAKSIHEARMGCLFASALKILPVFLFVLPGLCGRILFPDIDSAEIFPTLVQNLLPEGLKGLLAAALIAALMSSIDSTLNSTGTLISLDIFKHFYPESSEQKMVKVGQWATLIVMIFGVLWVLVVMRAESLFQYLQQVNAAISPPIAATFLVGVFWKKANHTGAMTALVGGLVVGVLFMIFEPFSFLIGAGVNFAISLGLLYIGSCLGKPVDEEKIKHLTWSQASVVIDAEVTSQQKTIFRALSGVIIATMTYLWWSFS